MRFKIDENLPREVAGLLEDDGHDALTVFAQGHAGSLDSSLSEICRSEGRVIVTLDLDFSNVRLYPPEEHPGIIVLRLEHQDKETVVATVSRILPILEVEPLEGRLWIVEPDRVRIWRPWE